VADSFTTSDSAETIAALFQDYKDLILTSSHIILKHWHVHLGELDKIQLKLENQINNLLKLEDYSKTISILDSFFISSLNSSFTQLQSFINKLFNIQGSDIILSKPINVAAVFVVLFLQYKGLHSIAKCCINFFAKGFAQATINSDIKQLKGNLAGWDEELLSKINTFYAGRLELMIKTVRLVEDNYDTVGVIQEVIRAASEHMDINVTILRSCIDDMCKSFLNSKYSVCQMELLLKDLDDDRWQEVPIKKQYECMLEYLHTSELKTIPQCEEDKTVDRINGSFLLVNSALTILKIVCEYMVMVQHLPNISYECAVKLIEILTIYNIKSSSLVLGAGAVELNKMKNITAKHLAMNAQAVDFLYGEIEYIKAKLGLYLGEKQRLLLEGDFSNLKSDLLKHRNDIYKKLSSILLTMGSNLLDEMKKIEYKNDTGKTSEFITSLTTALQQMYQVLIKILPKEHIELIYQDTFNELSSRLRLLKSEIRVNGVKGLEQLKRDLKDLETGIDALGTKEISKGIKIQIGEIIEEYQSKYK